jgi:hypothetical protein
MAPSSSQKRKALKASLKSTHTRRKKVVALAAAFSAAAVALAAALPYLDKVPQHDSILTGHAWVQELLAGHPRRFYNMMGLTKPVFRQLLHELGNHAGLANSKHISSEEQLAIFLRICCTGATNRDMQEHFQHSADTISK